MARGSEENSQQVRVLEKARYRVVMWWWWLRYRMDEIVLATVLVLIASGFFWLLIELREDRLFR